jgi:peptide/nickel transport system substrate-binding protein
MKNKTIALAALLGAALALSACSGDSSTTDPTTAATSGGGDAPATTVEDAGDSTSTSSYLSIGTLFPPDGWEIGISGGGFASTFFSAVYDPLLLIDENNEVYGVLAESWTVSDDELTYTFDLHTDGVVFSDGEQFSADTAVANIEYLATGYLTAPAYARMESVTKVDDDTFSITLSKPDPAFLYQLGLGNTYFTSAKALSDPAYSQSTEPVGSGPYTFDAARSTPQADYYFTKKADYWDAAKWPWEEIRVSAISDSTARQNAMMTDEIMIEYGGTSQIDPAAQYGWTITAWESNLIGLIYADRAGEINPALGDVRVRQAIDMSFDREAFYEMGGGAAVGKITNQVFAGDYNDAALNEQIVYDPEAAKALLAEAGYPDGFTLELPMNPLFADYQPMVEQSLTAIGITPEWVNMDPVSYNQQLGNYGAFLAAFDIQGNPVATVQRFFENGWANPFDSASKVPELQALIDQLYVAGADVDSLIAEINTYATENYWFSIWTHEKAFVVSKDTFGARPVVGLMFPNLQQFIP